MKWASFLLILFLHSPAQALFYQTSQISLTPQKAATWEELGLNAHLLSEAVDALTGKRFPHAPPEWFYYFSEFSLEDEERSCLANPKRWRLVALRVLPFARPLENSSPELRLTFQPFCHGSEASDTALQVHLSAPQPHSSILEDWIKSIPETQPVSFLNVGFIPASTLALFHDMPAPLNSREIARKLPELKKQGFQIKTLQWMASLPGQLDWVFGRLQIDKGFNTIVEPVIVRDQRGFEIVNLGNFDFLPLVLREDYLQLPLNKKNQLAPYHVSEDLHADLTSAKNVLDIDERLSHPLKTRHDQTSCIECHSSQERMERTQDFIDHGGAKEFGYFFRGLGYIGQSPYISWRSVRESRVWSEKIRESIEERR